MSNFDFIKGKLGHFTAGNTLTAGMNIAAMASDYHTFKEYGTGAGILMSLTSGLLPWWGDLALGLGQTAKALGDQMYEKQEGKMKSSFESNPINDQFGNIATMRQRSQYSLSRNRNALGKEAQLFHMKF